MGGLGPGLSLGGAGGAGMAGCLGCGRGRLLAPSSLVSRRTCWPPLHFRAAGEGDGAASLSSLLPATCFAAQFAVPSAEPGRRLATSEDLPGRNGGVGTPGASGEGVTTSLDPGVRSLGRCCPTEGSGLDF